MKPHFEIGDSVAVLDDVLSGKVIAVKGTAIRICTTDGFELVFEAHELVKIATNDALDVRFNGQLSQILQEKSTPVKRSFTKEKKSKKDDFVLEIDLHIEKLVPSKKGMTNYDILTLQIETAQRQLEFAQRNRMPKVVFIHGVGEGVLKAELDFLFGRFEGLSFQDADYRKYGLGATEVYFKQNPNR